MLIQEAMDIQEKLKILSDAAKYDVACTSSGVARRGQKGALAILMRQGFVTALRQTAGVFRF